MNASMIKPAAIGATAGVLISLLGWGLAGVLFFAPVVTATGHQPPVTHEQMHQMMDAVHGAGASQRMHEAMGPEAEQLMDQCVAMMGMMQGMANTGQMMSGSAGQMEGMMGGMQGMMGRGQ